MASTFNLSLTDELLSFVHKSSGDGTLYATPSEFVRDVLRDKKQRIEAEEMRNAIIEGYNDAIKGNTHRYAGNLKALLKKIK
jgi:antitoxin ParD1/3/4